MSIAEPPIVPAPAPHRWTVEQFMALLEADIFEEGWKVELLDGIIVTQMPPGPEHDFAYEAFYHAMTAMGLHAKGMIPMLKFIVRGRSALEPDFARYRPESVGRYGNKEAADLLWAVEVSVTSLDYDLGSKKASYAAANVPDYWVIDVESRVVRTFTNPVGGSYAEERSYPEGEAIPLPGLDGTLDTAKLFPLPGVE